MTEFFAPLLQYGDWGLLALRIAVGAIFLVHGTQKWAMWKMQSGNMLGMMRLLSIVEPLSGLAVLLGVWTQLGALLLGIIMLGALYFKITKWNKKFSEAGGWEEDLVILAVCIMLLVTGPGSIALG